MTDKANRRTKAGNASMRLEIDAQEYMLWAKVSGLSYQQLGLLWQQLAEALENRDREFLGKHSRFIRRIVWGSALRPHIPLDVRRAVYERDCFRCQRCASTERLSLDHVIHYSLGGPDTEQNLRVLCLDCNRKRGNRE